MTIRYEYKCDSCGRGYIEQRKESLDQIVTSCECGGNFKLFNQTLLEN
jgi:predicted nucleic acid-binding Zn ribbon protein